MQEFIWSLFDKKLISHSDVSISYEEKFKIVEKILLKYNAAHAESTVGSLLSFSYSSSYASSAAIPIQSQNKKVSKASDDFNFSRSSALIPTPEESFSHRSDSVLLNMIGAKKFSYT